MASADESFDHSFDVYNEKEEEEEDDENMMEDQNETNNFDLNEKLIILVRSFPMIWDQSLPDFRNKTQREDIWQLISKMLGRKVTDVTNKWRLIRDKYARELQKRRKMKGSEHEDDIKWRYFDAMSFLQKHVKPRRRIRAVDKREIPMSSSSSHEDPEANGYDSPIEVEVPFTSLCVTNLDEEDVSPPFPSYSSDNSSETEGNIYDEDDNDDDGFAMKIIAEISETRQVFDGVSRRLGLLTDQTNQRTVHKRIDRLCQLMSDTYMSLPLQLQEEYDIEVLRLLKEYRNKAKNMET